MKQFIVGLVLILLILLASAQSVRAELLFETVDNIQIPTNVTFGTQIEWQGHIVYSIRDAGRTYEVKIARDGEPHQFPYFFVSFTKDWQYLGTTKHINPEAEKKAVEETRRKAEEDKARAQADQDIKREEKERLDREKREQEEREKNKPPEPPIVKPPDEEPTPVEPPPDPDPVPPPSE